MSKPEKPQCSSTPNRLYDLRRRRSIHDKAEDISDIIKEDNTENFKPQDKDETDSELSKSESDIIKEDNTGNLKADDKDDETESEPSESECSVHTEQDGLASKRRKSDTLKTTTNEDPYNLNNFFYVLAIIVFLLVTFVYFEFFYEENARNVTIEMIKVQFPNQSTDLWDALDSGIDETINFNRVSTFVLLYKSGSEPTLDKILKSTSEYILCKLSSCDETPVILNVTTLNSPRAINDFGTIIEDYRGDLERKKLMIVKNIEEVVGATARVFHTFCDGEMPLVEKSMIIFTMKVPEFNANNIKFIENYLRERWSDIEGDKFHPLFTRIANIALEVAP